jgi:hypothetical protein
MSGMLAVVFSIDRRGQATSPHSVNEPLKFNMEILSIVIGGRKSAVGPQMTDTASRTVDNWREESQVEKPNTIKVTIGLVLPRQKSAVAMRHECVCVSREYSHGHHIKVLRLVPTRV